MRRATTYTVQAAMLVLVFFAAPQRGDSGGPHVDVQVVGFEARGGDEFTVRLALVDQESAAWFDENEQVTVHLRHAVTGNHLTADKAVYLGGINELIGHYRTGDILQLGLIGQPTRLPETTDEYQGHGLLSVARGAVHVVFTLPGEG